MTQTVKISPFMVCKSNLDKPLYNLNNRIMENFELRGVVYSNAYHANQVEPPEPYAIASTLINSDIIHFNGIEDCFRHAVVYSNYDFSIFEKIVIAKDVTYKNCRLIFKDRPIYERKNTLIDVVFEFENCTFENCIFEFKTKKIKIETDQFKFM